MSFLSLGETTLTAHYTPGNTPGGTTYADYFDAWLARRLEEEISVTPEK